MLFRSGKNSEEEPIPSLEETIVQTKKKPRNTKSSPSSFDEANTDLKQNEIGSFPPERQEDDSGSPKEPANNKKETEKGKASDREERSRRRQAMIEVEAQTTTSKRPRVAASGGQAKKVKVKGARDDGRVKVPMLTGTLYLYRGARRRAEFAIDCGGFTE